MYVFCCKHFVTYVIMSYLCNQFLLIQKSPLILPRSCKGATLKSIKDIHPWSITSRNNAVVN